MEHGDQKTGLVHMGTRNNTGQKIMPMVACGYKAI